MNTRKKHSVVQAAFLLLLCTFEAAFAANAPTTMRLESADTDIHDRESLMRGAEMYGKYCLSCHSATYMRYSRIAKDLELSEKELSELMYADASNATMLSTLDENLAQTWFGIMPPDLSLIARSRGTDWLYNYFRAFYSDDSRPFGVNNHLLPNVGMPHVLWSLSGIKDANGTLIVPGSMNDQDYETAIRDLVNFLDYVGEPAKLQRYTIGMQVIGFLFILLIVCYLLKREYWRDIKKST